MSSSRSDVGGYNLQKLTGLAYPPPGIYQTHRIDFKLSLPQRTLVQDIVQHWECSVDPEVTRPVTETESAHIITFFESKHEAFQAALSDKRALHFDVLLLGIVSRVCGSSRTPQSAPISLTTDYSSQSTFQSFSRRLCVWL